MSNKPIIGISIGDLNGIGLELVIKTFSDTRILDLCTPVIFASNKVLNFYKKSVPESNFNYQIIKDASRIAPGKSILLTAGKKKWLLIPVS